MAPKRKSTTAAKSIILRLIDEGYGTRAWHGTNLRGSLRGLTAGGASFRPAPGRHNIWEIVVHAAYWKYTVRRRLLGEKRGSFPLKGSNWFTRPAPGSDWREDLRLLDEVHRSMRKAVDSIKESELGKKAKGSTLVNAHVIVGIGAHDIYHAGQIQLIKRLMKNSGRRGR